LHQPLKVDIVKQVAPTIDKMVQPMCCHH